MDRELENCLSENSRFSILRFRFKCSDCKQISTISWIAVIRSWSLQSLFPEMLAMWGNLWGRHTIMACASSCRSWMCKHWARKGLQWSLLPTSPLLLTEWFITCASEVSESLIDLHPRRVRREFKFSHLGGHLPLLVHLGHHTPQTIRVTTQSQHSRSLWSWTIEWRANENLPHQLLYLQNRLRVWKCNCFIVLRHRF